MEKLKSNKVANYSTPYFKVKTNLKAGLLPSGLQKMYYNNLGVNPALATVAQSAMIQNRSEVGAPQYP